MKKNVLTIFPQAKIKKVPKHEVALKEKEKIVDILAAGIERITPGDKESALNLKKILFSEVPGLFADGEHEPYCQNNKRDLRVHLEKKYPSAFLKPTLTYSTQIRDGMQDVLLNLIQSIFKFSQYFKFFWDVKISPNFCLAQIVVIDFDVQNRSDPPTKDVLRIKRDRQNTKTNQKMESWLVDDEAMLPSQDIGWNVFLSNRTNNSKLVLYLCHKMLDSNSILPENKKLYVSFEGHVYIVTSSNTTECPFKNNHEEANTRMFW